MSAQLTAVTAAFGDQKQTTQGLQQQLRTLDSECLAK
jgi:hypothetical protein